MGNVRDPRCTQSKTIIVDDDGDMCSFCSSFLTDVTLSHVRTEQGRAETVLCVIKRRKEDGKAEIRTSERNTHHRIRNDALLLLVHVKLSSYTWTESCCICCPWWINAGWQRVWKEK